MAAAAQRREFDFLIWGCTGVTGKLLASLMARRFGVNNPQCRIALGGRSEARLRDVAALMLAESLKSPDSEIRARATAAQQATDATAAVSLVPLVVVPEFGPNTDARPICARAEVVLALAGPFRTCGEPILKGCVESGTDYVDVTGEYDWVREMRSRYDTLAKANKTRILIGCGFASLLNDVGVTALQRQAQHLKAPPAKQIEQYCRTVGSRPSGGTLRTVLSTLSRLTVREFLCGKPGGVYEMCATPPDAPETLEANREKMFLSYSRLAKAWVCPTLLGHGMVRFIHWSNEMKGYPYGRDFVFHLGEKTDHFLVAVIKTIFSLAALMTVALLSRCERWAKQFIPAPGVGVGLAELEKPGHCVEVTTIGIVQPPSGTPQKVEHIITFNKGEGYAMSAYGVLETGLVCLKKRRNGDVTGPFGISCPSHLLSTAIEDQLRIAGFDMRLQVTAVDF